MKKKVLFVTNNMSGGGAERILNILVSHINRDKFEVSICSLHEPKHLNGWPEDINYFSIFKHNYDSKLGKLWGRLCNKIKILIYEKCPASVFYKLNIRDTYDTEIAFIEGYATRIVSGSANRNSNKLAWLHIDMFQNHWSQIAYKSDEEEQSAYKKFSRVFGVSISVAESLKILYPKLPNAEVMYNPVDTTEIIKKAGEFIPKVGNSEESVKLISVGRLVEQKGYDRLIPIIARLRGSGYNVELTILGDGTDRAKLESLISKYKLDNFVSLIGFVANPYPYVANADIFVCSSRSEGFSTVVTEALVLGVPVVATDCAGMKELLQEDSHYGILTENTEASLEDGIKRMLQTEIFKTYQDRAKERGLQFNLQSQMHILEQCL